MSPDRPVSTPIPLTVFEKYFLLDSTEDFPMLVDGEFRLSGDFDRKRFEEAVQNALRNHPLFTKRIEKRWGRYYWTVQNETFEMRWHDRMPDMTAPEWFAPMDLFKRCGLELHGYSEPGATTIFYRIHHLCCDGVGFFRFFCDVFADYASREGETIEIVPPVRPERIVDRDRFPRLELPKQYGFRTRLKATVRAVVKWMAEKPAPLVGRTNHRVDPGKGRFGKKTYVVSEEETGRLRDRARREECSPNDLLIAAIFVALKNAGEAETRTRKNVFQRVMIPVNMRWPESEDIPAANVISYVFLTRPNADCVWETGLTDEVRREMKLIKELKIGYMFLNSLRFFNSIPGGLRMMTGNKDCLASVVFTNTGNLEKFFNRFFPLTDGNRIRVDRLALEYVYSYVPCRSKTNLTVSASTQAGRLCLSCQYDGNFLSENDVDRFVDSIRDELASASPGP